MFKSIALASLLLSPAGAAYLQPQSGRCKPKGEANIKSITLGKNNRDIGACVNKCLNDDACVGMEFREPKFCELHYSDIQKIADASEGTYCGRVSKECKDASSFTFGSYEYEGETFDKDCAWLTANEKKIDVRTSKWCGEIVDGFPVGVMCAKTCGGCALSSEAPKDCQDSDSFVFGSYEYEGTTTVNDCAWITANESKTAKRQQQWCDEVVDGFLVKQMCQASCDYCSEVLPDDCEDNESYNFGSYEYEGETSVRDCAWITANEDKISKRQGQWCGEFVNGALVADMCQASCDVCATDSPTPSPTAKPTPSPTKAWAGNDSDCILQADLAFPFEDPDDAAYYGYVADYMAITMAGDDWWECSWGYSHDLPEWCTYSNSDPNGDSAYVANIDDYYFDDSLQDLWAETIKISEAKGNTYNILVTHWFFNQDYYPELDSWNDHMLAPILKVKNLSNPDQGQIKNKGWSRPVDKDTPTHIQKNNGEWKINPDFKDKFMVTVSCDKKCFCEASYSLV